MLNHLEPVNLFFLIRLYIHREYEIESVRMLNRMVALPFHELATPVTCIKVCISLINCRIVGHPPPQIY